MRKRIVQIATYSASSRLYPSHHLAHETDSGECVPDDEPALGDMARISGVIRAQTHWAQKWGSWMFDCRPNTPSGSTNSFAVLDAKKDSRAVVNL